MTARFASTIRLGALIFIAIALAQIGLGTVLAHDDDGDDDRDELAGTWMAGDFHQHTFFTDGGRTLREVIANGFGFGLHWQANSEHGGFQHRDGEDHFWDDPLYYPVNPILGDVRYKTVDGVEHQVMWRWQSLKDYAFATILELRAAYPDKLIASGLEWNVPGHEHCSSGIVAPDAYGIAQFEYLFDRGDADGLYTTTGGAAQGFEDELEKSFVNNHAKAMAAVEWLGAHYPQTSWLVFAHPERAASYEISDFRAFNNAAPTVAFGFEGMPGHQKSSDRGGYRSSADGGGTYGGAGYYIAKVGGLWDALLGEGRRWWTFVSSDFHAPSGDFWPGEYAKTWTYVVDADGDGEYTLEEIVDALRSGNSFSVHGDLIDALEFTVEADDDRATMGEALVIEDDEDLVVSIRFRSPEYNHRGDAVQVDHVDLIAGAITGLIDPDDKDFATDTNASTRVLATFSRNEWTEDDDGWVSLRYVLEDVENSLYFRLRGTNLAPNTPYETDAAGNPLPDHLVTEYLGIDGQKEAWRDLWFYSNPVFVYVRD